MLFRSDFNLFFLPANTPLSVVLEEKKNEWKLIYADKEAYVFVKNIPQNGRWIEKYADVRPVSPTVLEAEAKSKSTFRPYAAFRKQLKEILFG